MTYVDNGFRARDLKIEYKHLFCRGEDTGWFLEPHKKHKYMWWIVFEDGNKSADFYNLTRAKENMCVLYLSEKNRIAPEALGWP